MRMGENLLKYFKMGWNRKEGTENKDFKRGGRQAGSKSGCLKKGGWNPLANYGKCEEVYTSTKY